MKQPKRLGTMTGKYVRSLTSLQTHGGHIFPQGTIFYVADASRGITLEAINICHKCAQMQRTDIKLRNEPNTWERLELLTRPRIRPYDLSLQLGQNITISINNRFRCREYNHVSQASLKRLYTILLQTTGYFTPTINGWNWTLI